MKEAKKEKQLNIIGTELSSVSIKNERLIIKCILSEDDSALPILRVEISNSDIQNHSQLKSVVKNILELKNLLFEVAHHKGLSIQDETIIVDLSTNDLFKTKKIKLRTKICLSQRIESSAKTEETRSEQSNSEEVKPLKTKKPIAQQFLILAIVATVICCSLGFGIYLQRSQNNQLKSTLSKTEVELKEKAEQSNRFEGSLEKEKSQNSQLKSTLSKTEVELNKANNEAQNRVKKYYNFKKEFKDLAHKIYTATDGVVCGKTLSEYSINKLRQLQIKLQDLI